MLLARAIRRTIGGRDAEQAADVGVTEIAGRPNRRSSTSTDPTAGLHINDVSIIGRLASQKASFGNLPYLSASTCWPRIRQEKSIAAPAFTLQDCVEYPWTSDGPFVGEAQVIDVLSDGRYRLKRLDGPPFLREGSIFGEEQLRLKQPNPA